MILLKWNKSQVYLTLIFWHSIYEAEINSSDWWNLYLLPIVFCRGALMARCNIIITLLITYIFSDWIANFKIVTILPKSWIVLFAPSDLHVYIWWLWKDSVAQKTFFCMNPSHVYILEVIFDQWRDNSMMMMMCTVSIPGRHDQIMRWCGLEQVLFCSNPVPTLDSGQPRPRLCVTNPHSLSQTRRSSMPMTRDEWNKYNRKRTKDRNGEHQSN